MNFNSIRDEILLVVRHVDLNTTKVSPEVFVSCCCCLPALALSSFSLRPCFPSLVPWLPLSLCLLWLLPGGSFFGRVGHHLHLHPHFSLEPSRYAFLRERVCVCATSEKCTTTIPCGCSTFGILHTMKLLPLVGRGVAAGGPQYALRTVLGR